MNAAVSLRLTLLSACAALVDWTVIHVGAVAPAANGVITVNGHGLTSGDTAYIAASPGTKVNQTSGAIPF